MPIPSAEGVTCWMVLLAHRKDVGYRAKKVIKTSFQMITATDFPPCTGYWPPFTNHCLDFCEFFPFPLLCLFIVPHYRAQSSVAKTFFSVTFEELMSSKSFSHINFISLFKDILKASWTVFDVYWQGKNATCTLKPPTGPVPWHGTRLVWTL